jgi:hypothetical protein
MHNINATRRGSVIESNEAFLAQSNQSRTANWNFANHPLAVIAASVIATATLCLAVVQGVVLPSATGSLDHRLAVQTDKTAEAEAVNSNLRLEIASLTDKIARLSQTTAENWDKRRTEASAYETEIAELKQQIFELQHVSVMAAGSPYPVGLDLVRLGDDVAKVSAVYPNAELSGHGISQEFEDGIFLRAYYGHSFTNESEGQVTSARFSMGRLSRIVDDLPRIDDSWLESALKRALGSPTMIIGLDNDCLFWKASDTEFVYYSQGDDSFSIHGLESYPAGCEFPEIEANSPERDILR